MIECCLDGMLIVLREHGGTFRVFLKKSLICWLNWIEWCCIYNDVSLVEGERMIGVLVLFQSIF